MLLRLSGLLCAMLVLLPFNARAALIDNGNGLIYDDDLNITWYVGESSSAMTWGTADSWANFLTIGGASE